MLDFFCNAEVIAYDLFVQLLYILHDGLNKAFHRFHIVLRLEDESHERPHCVQHYKRNHDVLVHVRQTIMISRSQNSLPIFLEVVHT
jgi:hypothetical protein